MFILKCVGRGFHAFGHMVWVHWQENGYLMAGSPADEVEPYAAEYQRTHSNS